MGMVLCFMALWVFKPQLLCFESWIIGQFTVLCLVTWPLNGSEAGGDLALIETSQLLL